MLFVACCFSQCIVTFEQFIACDNYNYILLKSYSTIIILYKIALYEISCQMKGECRVGQYVKCLNTSFATCFIHDFFYNHQIFIINGKCDIVNIFLTSN
jgi:hypothetical protein